MMQKRISIRYTKACWLINKNLELVLVTERLRVTIVQEDLASGRMKADEIFRICLNGHRFLLGPFMIAIRAEGSRT